MNGKQLKVGVTIIHEGGLWRVMSANIIAPGNWRAFVQTKLRNIVTGSQTEIRFRTDQEVERANLEQRAVQYLYQDGDTYHFMDNKTYDQFHMMAEMLGDAVKFMTPNMNLSIEMHDGTPIGVDLPKTVKLKVTQTDPFLKTATVTNTYKAATIETGATIQVPGFVSDGDLIEIDTASGEYIGRAK